MCGKTPTGIPFAVPKDHSADYYYSLINTKGYSVKTQFKMKYPDAPSAHWPLPHSPELPIPDPPLNITCKSEYSEKGKCIDPDFQEDLESKETPSY